MKLYADTEKELTFDDYKPLPALRGLSLAELQGLKENLENAIENAFLFGSELLSFALNMDVEKVNIHIRMETRKQAKAKQANREPAINEIEKAILALKNGLLTVSETLSKTDTIIHNYISFSEGFQGQEITDRIAEENLLYTIALTGILNNIKQQERQ